MPYLDSSRFARLPRRGLSKHTAITHHVQLSQLDAQIVMAGLADLIASCPGSSVVATNLYRRLAAQIDAERAAAGLVDLKLHTL